MTQWRLINCALCVPSFRIVTVYENAYRRSFGAERSEMYWVCTVTRIPSVTAEDMVAKLPEDVCKRNRNTA